MNEATDSDAPKEGDDERLDTLIEENPERFERLMQLAARALDARGVAIESERDGAVERLVWVGSEDDADQTLDGVFRTITSGEEPRVLEVSEIAEGEEGALSYEYCAGVPIRLPSGQRIGIVALFEGAMDDWGPEQDELLEEVGGSVADTVELQLLSRKLRRSNEELNALIEASPLAVVTFDRDGRVRRWSRSAEEMFGYEAEEVIGSPFPMMTEGTREETEEFLEWIFSGQSVKNREIERPTKYGEIRVLRLSAAPVFGPDGTVQKGISLVEDVTERRRRERALQRSEQRFRRVFEEAGIGIALVGLSGHIQKANPALAEMLEYSRRELAGMDFVDITYPEDAEKDAGLFEEIVQGERERYQIEKRYCTKSGDVRWARLTVSAVNDPSGEVQYMLGMVEDVTTQKEAEQELVFRAQHDALTGLINRETFEERLRHRMEEADQAEEYGYAVLFIDLDDLKEVNDRLGHGAGDELLVQTGERLEELLRTGDSVARIGGDEFAVLLEHVGESEEVMIVAERLQTGLAVSVAIEDEVLYPSASVGIALGGPEYGAPSEILREADSAMYEAKDRGGARIALSNEPERGRAERSRELAAEMERALEDDELELALWPVEHLSSGELRAAVAEPIWQHPDRGELTAEPLRRAVGSGGMASRLEHWLIEHAGRSAREWRDLSGEGEGLQLFVPCASDFCTRPSFVETLGEGEIDGIGAEGVVVGLPEPDFPEGRRMDREVIRAYRDLELGVGVDAYGSGELSMRIFSRFELELVVLDAMLLNELTPGGGEAPLLRSIFGVADEFGQTVVASGVESEAQRERLLEIGCSWGTGSEISAALDSDQLRERIEASGS